MRRCRFARLIGHDGGMRLQFSTRSILLATAFTAAVCGVVVAYRHLPRARNYAFPWEVIALHFAFTAPLWIPGLFIAYAIGRRKFTVWLVVAFVLTELVALILSWRIAPWMYIYLFTG